MWVDWAFIVYISFCLVKLATSHDWDLPLNLQSPFAREVQRIEHHVKTCEVRITFKSSRKCLQPIFRLRISGVSLSIPHLLRIENNTYIYGYSPLIDEGLYFVEVVALMCDTFDPENFVHSCLEAVNDGANVVTLPYKFRITMNLTAAEKRPRWVLYNKNKASLLPTRYQKTNCMSEEFFWCPTKRSELWQYNSYNWVDGPDYTKSIQDVLAINRGDQSINGVTTTDDLINICLMGDSHSHMLKMYGVKLNVSHIQFIYIPSSFPHEFNITTLATNKCSYAVVTYGQWPASSMTKGHPYTESKYREEMRRVMTLLQHYDHNMTQVFVRSVNYNPLMARQTTCPPTDYRNPIVIDMYNNVLAQLSIELNVEYIDLNPIMGPMWDSAQDWNHPVGKVAIAEIEWILSYIVQSSLRHKHGPVLHANESTLTMT